MTGCYCGQKDTYENCCLPIIKGDSTAATAEQLMRARYSAYVTGEIDFLHDSLHPAGRDDFDYEATENWAGSSEWLDLTILNTKSGGANDKVGQVEFVAAYKDKEGNEIKHSERSHFKKIGDVWYFCDGQAITPQKVGRNAPCSCGSGKKYKKCCGA